MLALCGEKVEVGLMKVLTLLLHDERFSGWTSRDMLVRHHFSLQYLRFYRQQGFEPSLYRFHQRVSSRQTYEFDNVGKVKVFPVRFRFPPFLRFGNDHNPWCVMREMFHDQPDLVHYHNYYLSSFPYIAVFTKKKLKRPLIAQLHGYDNRSLHKMMYLPCLLALKNADKILYSYRPENEIYRKINVANKAVRLPVPGIDPEIFKPQRRFASNRLLYVGRIPSPEAAYGEKSPFLLVKILKRLVHRSKDVNLDIVGDGPGLFDCQELARRLGISDHVVFHGYVPNHEVPRYYRASTLTFSPIQVYDIDGWFDGSIQESLACGTPVAAFKESRSTPLDGTYGFLLSNRAEKAADELFLLLKKPEEMDEVAMEGSKFVRENCSCDRVVSELKTTLESVV
jgi:glycosyltransferase involved in cell wall biosynthesis